MLFGFEISRCTNRFIAKVFLMVKFILHEVYPNEKGDLVCWFMELDTFKSARKIAE